MRTTRTSVAPGASTAPEALDLSDLLRDPDPDEAARRVASGLWPAFRLQFRAEGGPRPDFHRQLWLVRQLAHRSIDANLDELARQVDAGDWGPLVGRRLPAHRPLRVLPGGQL